MSRVRWLATTAAAMVGIGLTAGLHPVPKLIWNASASVPIGLYAVHPVGDLKRGALVVVAPPEDLARFLAERGYLPEGVPLLKRVEGVAGQTICRTDHTVTVDGLALGEALDRDHLGRPLPDWQGCRRLDAGEVFLMNPDAPASLDGRYFGPLPLATIVGRATTIWTDDKDRP